MKQLSKKSVGRLITLFYSLGVLVHLLVVAQFIPYAWVGGGRAESYQVQVTQSVTSIVIITLLFLFVRKTMAATAPKKWKYYFLYAITAFWVVGLVAQIAGTDFERYFMSLVLLLGVVSHILLIRRLRFSGLTAKI